MDDVDEDGEGFRLTSKLLGEFESMRIWSAKCV